MKPVLLPSVYLGNIAYYSILLHRDVVIEHHENFVKQTYRNRCKIYGANGALNLIVPLHRKGNHTPITEVRVAYEENWRKLHVRSIEAAYRSSPYFEYYETEFMLLYEEQYEHLIELNNAFQAKILELLQASPSISITSTYEKETESKKDFRSIAHPHQVNTCLFPSYLQVFSNKHGFIPNLSILDLLFNEGPNSTIYLENLMRQHSKLLLNT